METKIKRSYLSALLLLWGITSISLENAKADAYGWGSLIVNGLGTGVNGTIYAVSYLDPDIIVAGRFTQAGGISVNNIARWSPASGWRAMGTLDDTVYALAVFNGQLYAGGFFSLTGGSFIGRWDGNLQQWVSVGGGMNNPVRALTVFSSLLHVGGDFTVAGSVSANHVASWNGMVWQRLGTAVSNGVNNYVHTLASYGGELYVGGRFDSAGGNISANFIARWNVSQWQSVGTGTNGTNNWVNALAVHGTQLAVGGSFTTAGGNNANRIAFWDGSWSPAANGMDNTVLTLTSFRNELIAAGVFRYANGHYVDRIAKWNGADWSRMITGTNNRVSALFVRDTILFAGGNFTTAGGKYISRIGTWSNQITDTIRGVVRYRDNGPVTSGSVKALRIDVNTREIITVDSTGIQPNGTYVLGRVLRDTNTYILSYPPDEFLRMQQPTYVPTYYPSSVDWQGAVRLNPQGNLDSINIHVYRITPLPENPLAADVSGHVYLNFTPPMNRLDVGFPYKSGAVVYVKQDTLYRMFDVSNTLEEYLLPQLAPGTYQFYVNRMGYQSAFRTVEVGNVNIDTIDFYLDTVSLIGIQTISTEVPKEFRLEQNYPNPFNVETVIRYQLSVNSFVSLKVYDLLGREVETLVSEEFRPGIYQVTWNALNFSSGVYVYRLVAGEFVESKRMVLIK